MIHDFTDFQLILLSLINSGGDYFYCFFVKGETTLIAGGGLQLRVAGSGVQAVRCCVAWNSGVDECELRVSLQHLVAACMSFLNTLILFSHSGNKTTIVPTSEDEMEEFENLWSL